MLSDGPSGWEEKFVIHPGEIPWWKITEPRERDKVCKRQYWRMYCKLHPGRSAEANRESRKRHPGAAAEAQRKHNKRYPNAAAEARRKHQEKHPSYRAETMRKWNEEHPGVSAERKREWYKNHPGYNALAHRKWNEEHPGVMNERVKKWNREHPGIAAERNRRFRGTPEGRAALARGSAKRRKRATDPALYAARVYILHDLQESCAKCRAPYDITHQIDHILALCLGGTDDWSNLQPLCLLCHRRKSVEETREFRKRN